ncbi:flagellar motor switch protein FliN/FliY [Mariprofundus aestuarium]|uniref:Flagellar motor switch protein FliN n=1 Tax=Mariprofundus aestuarium TaxID=1921086 RepID=A0A2K8KUZ2_MARES|nr:FliM/FliN family flagellar motor switch protein [Mariprofundus aestuarium]ATX78570.1 flagellar motor switch protein FliN/FliY [Mariprofundus aestuarium]
MTEQTQEVEQQAIEQEISTKEHSPSNLESLMHIPLEVSVELARVKLPLHSVVRIGRGTVLQMGKEADSQVDIMANGSIFARGEVVKANGKLGVRITNIVTPEERIRALS